MGRFCHVLRLSRRTLGAPAHQQSDRVHFLGVRLRTNASKRLRVPESALYLVFKLVLRLSLNWRGINAPNQLRLLLAGHQFRDGQLVLEDVRGPTLTQAVGA